MYVCIYLYIMNYNCMFIDMCFMKLSTCSPVHICINPEINVFVLSIDC